MRIFILLVLMLFSFSFSNELEGKWIFKSVKGAIWVIGISGYKIPATFYPDGTVDIGNVNMFKTKKYYEISGNILKLWIGKKSKRNFTITTFKIEDFDGRCYKLKYIKAPVKNKYGALLCKY